MTDTVTKNVPTDFPLLNQEELTENIHTMRDLVRGMLQDYKNGNLSEEQSVESFLKVTLYAMNSGVKKGIAEGQRQVEDYYRDQFKSDHTF